MSGSTPETVLEVDELSKTFRVGFWRRHVEAVREVSFEVAEAEIFGLVGPNGAGKTTTMKMMTGLIFPDAGTAELFGEPVTRAEGRRRLGYLPEEPYFYEHLTAPELLRYYGALHGMTRDEVDEQLDDLLELVGLADVRRRPLRKFSKGMRQRAGIAQALVNDPDLVILDEPQSGLDPIGRRDVRDLIFRLRKEGTTVIFSSHILVDVEAVCDRVAIMNEGELVDVADLEQLESTENQVVEVTFEGIASEEAAAIESVESVDDSGAVTVLKAAGSVDVAELIARLDDRGARIVGVDRRSGRLEKHFLDQDVPNEDAEPASRD